MCRMVAPRPGVWGSPRRLQSDGQPEKNVGEESAAARLYAAAVSDSSDLVASGYEAFYARWGESPTLRRIWREQVTGSDYPEEFAHISFLPLAQLRSLDRRLDPQS